jgi:hypothetical protein
MLTDTIARGSATYVSRRNIIMLSWLTVTLLGAAPPLGVLLILVIAVRYCLKRRTPRAETPEQRVERLRKGLL